MSPHTLDTRALDPRFREEMDAMTYVHEQVRARRPLPVAEAEAVAHSLSVGMNFDGSEHLPQMPLHDMSEYVSVHAINVAILSMAVAEHLGTTGSDVRTIGLAALLHDIGMALVPVELLAKAEQLTEEERALVTQHPVDGARIIIEAEPSLALPAIVAYEHHLRSDGSGYPHLLYPRQAHTVSRIVQVCDTFHALRSPRPFRQPWPSDITNSFINQRAGFEFDPRAATALLEVAKRRLPEA